MAFKNALNVKTPATTKLAAALYPPLNPFKFAAQEQFSPARSLSPPEIKIYRIKDLALKLSIGRSTIYKLLKDGKFPRPLALGGGKSVGWAASSISDYLASLEVK